MKVTVSVPDALFEKVEQLAARLGLSRRRLYTLALERFVEDETITANINEVYATESSNLDPIFQSIQSRSVKI
ncbi:MAG: hypothetical protein QOE68_745 [Thermoanaerobaculia bacterium]|nr:hypothetical protein [Thermoanaerobaculia bacterium]